MRHKNYCIRVVGVLLSVLAKVLLGAAYKSTSVVPASMNSYNARSILHTMESLRTRQMQLDTHHYSGGWGRGRENGEVVRDMSEPAESL